jgi:threonylcarbamoyladenosine tRNA methylthiotransferase MtaB
VSASPTVAVSTLGCRLNQVESQEMLALLESHGYRPAAAGERAGIHIVNTCTVTGRADFSDRQAIRRIARESPGALLVVTGCYAQTNADEVARIPGVDLVVGNQEKYRLPELLGDLGPRRQPAVMVADVADARGVPAAPFSRVSGRSRAFVKIQDGCQHRCAFCIVPAARGPSRSQDPGVVLDQIAALVEAGYPEVTLTGVDIGHYGWDLTPRTTLAALIERIGGVPGLRWLRLSSVLPSYFTEELIDVISRPGVVAPHLHLPLQSGSDRVLRLMRRPYNARMYRALAERLAVAIPGLGLGADIIAGHPGEQEEDFRATEALVEALPLSYLHVFPYSERRGTEATRLPARVPRRTIRERSARLRELGQAKNLEFRRRLVGQRPDVLVLAARDRETGFLAGLTANYVEVLFDGPADLARTFARVRLSAAGTERTFGVLEEVDR